MFKPKSFSEVDYFKVCPPISDNVACDGFPLEFIKRAAFVALFTKSLALKN